ncbi:MULTISPECIES: PAN domain-containing protein [unclassified Mesorhizobium]|uniref:PAN domain-containing protein n=1 Tax=unclassified Mesorhizobium TaxID=325217 RepID=UPI001FDA35BD|nr:MULTISPECIES: PAN domain-containing protein [unclassified Mesorhizobium]
MSQMNNRRMRQVSEPPADMHFPGPRTFETRILRQCFYDRIAGLLLAVIGAIAAAVILPSGVRPASAQSTEELFRYPQTFLNGVVSATVSVPLDSCSNLCAARSGCAGFDHSSDGGVCRLFASVAGAGQSQGHTAATRSLVTGYRQPMNPPAPPQASEPSPQPVPPEQEAVAVMPPPATFTRFLNRDLKSEAAETRQTESVEQCESMCRTSGGWCKAFTYDAWNRKCFLKERPGQLSMNARATSGVVSGSETPSASGSAVYFEYFNGKAFSGNGFRVLAARSRDECERDCSSQDQCIAFGFTQSQKRCVLFDQPGEYSSSRGTDSGAKRQD